MTTKEVMTFIHEAKQREQTALMEIAATSRALVPLLKDRQMTETAKDLETKLFLLDAIKQESESFIKANTEDFFKALMQSLDRKERP